MRTFRNFSFLFPALICLAILGQSTRTHAQSAASSALPPPPHAKEIHLKHVLVIAQTKGWEHDSIPAAMVAVYNMGKESGLWDTTLRTDTKLLTKKELKANAKNLNYFDLLVFCSTTGELDIDAGQKQDILSFVHDDGKGFVGIHAALDTNYTWPEYGEMIGGWFNDHPFDTFNAPIINEDPTFPAVRHFPAAFVKYDEIYQAKILVTRQSQRAAFARPIQAQLQQPPHPPRRSRLCSRMEQALRQWPRLLLHARPH